MTSEKPELQGETLCQNPQQPRFALNTSKTALGGVFGGDVPGYLKCSYQAEQSSAVGIMSPPPTPIHPPTHLPIYSSMYSLYPLV